MRQYKRNMQKFQLDDEKILLFNVKKIRFIESLNSLKKKAGVLAEQDADDVKASERIEKQIKFMNRLDAVTTRSLVRKIIKRPRIHLYSK